MIKSRDGFMLFNIGIWVYGEPNAPGKEENQKKTRRSLLGGPVGIIKSEIHSNYSLANYHQYLWSTL